MAFKRGLKWQGSAIINGERKRLSFNTLQEAELFEQNPYAYLKVEPKANALKDLFPQWSRELWGGTRNERNALRITVELVKRLGPTTPITKVDRARIKALIEELRTEGNKDSTINSKMATLSKLLAYAVDERVLESVPKVVFNKMPRGRIRSLSRDEEKRIIDALPDTYRHYAYFLLYSGCRVSEALKLEWEDAAGDQVTFWRTKTDKPRSIPLASKAREALAYSREKSWKRPFEKVVYSTFMNEWNKAKKAAGLSHDKQVVPHVLRHTCATRLAQSGMDPLRLQEWLGHATLQMTARYTHLNVNDLRVGLRALESGF